MWTQKSPAAPVAVLLLSWRNSKFSGLPERRPSLKVEALTWQPPSPCKLPSQLEPRRPLAPAGFLLPPWRWGFVPAAIWGGDRGLAASLPGPSLFACTPAPPAREPAPSPSREAAVGSGDARTRADTPPENKYRAHLVEGRSLFAMTSPSVHSVQRPENINNLYLVVTSRRESKRANAHRDWSHLALRKPATSRPVDGRYGGHRFSSAMHGRRIIIQTLHPASGTTCIIPPQELSHLVGGEEVGNCCGGTGGGARAGDVGTITLLNDPRNCQL